MTVEKKKNTIGRRKRASARVRLESGTGKITVNGQEFAEYFSNLEAREMILEVFKAIGKENLYDVSAKVQGGGKKGQAESVRLGICRALVKEDEGLKTTLKALGFLTRDPRVKERKKPGLKKARRAPQWSKR